jgi:hypothetical protein
MNCGDGIMRREQEGREQGESRGSRQRRRMGEIKEEG